MLPVSGSLDICQVCRVIVHLNFSAGAPAFRYLTGLLLHAGELVDVYRISRTSNNDKQSSEPLYY